MATGPDGLARFNPASIEWLEILHQQKENKTTGKKQRLQVKVVKNPPKKQVKKKTPAKATNKKSMPRL